MFVRTMLVLLLGVTGVLEPSEASTRKERRAQAKQCRAMCPPQIDRCVSDEGRRPRACRRRVLRRCRQEGLQVCVQPTTTTTTLRRPTTTLRLTTTTVPTKTTTTITPTTTTSSSTVPPFSLGFPWVESGPIQWTTPPPKSALGGETFPVALTVDVEAPWVAVEGTVISCIPRGDSAECDGTFTGDLTVTEPTFAGAPGVFEFTGQTWPHCDYPKRAETGGMVARVFLVDGDGNRVGPFFSPAAWTKVSSSIGTNVRVSPASLEWSLTVGQVPAERTIGASEVCEGKKFPASGSTDQPWLSVAPQPNGTLLVSVDGAQIAAPGTYRGEVTVSTPGALIPFRVVPVTVWRTDIDFDWNVPASVESVERFTADVTVDGDMTALTGVVGGGVQGDPPATGPSPFSFFGATDFYPSQLSGAPGVFSLDAVRVVDCAETSSEGYLYATVTPTDALGNAMGTYTATSPPIELPPASGPVISTREHELTFHALAGKNPFLQTIGVARSCFPPGPVAIAVSDDAPWLIAVYFPDATFPIGSLSVLVNVAGLDPADSPFHATIQLSSPLAATPATVDVTLHVADLHAEWVTPPPATIEIGDDFTMALEITGDVDSISGTVLNCSGAASPDHDCLEGAPLGVGSFSGPPGLFTFSGHRDVDSDHGETARVAVEFTATVGETVMGPFFSPPVPIALPEPAKPWLDHAPEAISLLGLAGQSPLAARLLLWRWDSADIPWTATTDATWLRVERDAGVASWYRGHGPWIVADTTGLDPDDGPFSATVTIHAPGSDQGTITVPVTLTFVP